MGGAGAAGREACGPAFVTGAGEGVAGDPAWLAMASPAAASVRARGTVWVVGSAGAGD